MPESESLWQDDFRAIPAHAAANALRVKIEVPESHLFFISKFSGFSRKFEAEAVAIGGAIDEVEAAP
ncbi:MAG TPA: hypothetical protein PLP95_13820, partial [Microthrixaceae bacterium]|nr:hypothetical protein [Microthrixaceae bacterium]